MIRILSVFLITISIQCKPDVKSMQMDSVKCCIILEFNGFSRNFYKKKQLDLYLSNKVIDSKIWEGIENLAEIGYRNTQGALWSIDIYNSKGSWLCELLVLESGNYVFQIGTSLFKNDDLFDFLKNLMRVDEIGEYEGVINQNIYNSWFE